MARTVMPMFYITRNSTVYNSNYPNSLELLRSTSYTPEARTRYACGGLVRYGTATISVYRCWARGFKSAIQHKLLCFYLDRKTGVSLRIILKVHLRSLPCVGEGFGFATVELACLVDLSLHTFT